MATWDRDKMREYQRSRRAKLETILRDSWVDSVYVRLLEKNQTAHRRYRAMKEVHGDA